MKSSPIVAVLVALPLVLAPGCRKPPEEEHEESQTILVTSPEVKDIVSTEQYVCQIHSRRHIEIRALEGGYLQEISVKEGQVVKQGELLFKMLPTLYQARLDSENAEAQLAQIEFANTQKLFQDHVVSDKEVALAQAKLAKALAEMKLAQAELDFTEIRAPFDGIIDRLHEQQGSLIEEGDMLTTLSDNDVMWVYFNVPEARYFEYQAQMNPGSTPGAAADHDADDDSDDDAADDDYRHVAGHPVPNRDELQIELVLANRNVFPQPGKISAIEGEFNNETGNIAFRADFPNPGGLLRHGQTGSVLIHRLVHGAVVIPQRATFEILDKRFVYVVGEDDVVHQREIGVQHEMEDIYVVDEGVGPHDKIVLEGIRQVRDGEKVEYEFRPPEVVLSELKNIAE